MGEERINLTHEEVWDDSALLDSWNEALAEYKKYHSIYARGGSIRDLSRDGSSQMPANEPSKLSADEHGGTPDLRGTVSATKESPQNAVMASSPPANAPQALLGSMRDEGLKKLLMSWYYAGYYTGLFEGQQQQVQKG